MKILFLTAAAALAGAPAAAAPPAPAPFIAPAPVREIVDRQLGARYGASDKEAIARCVTAALAEGAILYGVNGGRIIAEGVPEEIVKQPLSATGQYLKPMLERASVKPVVVESKPKKVTRSRRVAVSDDEDELGLVAAK